MQFKIEKISEDSFYVNLLLGLPKVLAKFRKFGVKDHYIKRFQPLRENDICTWEHNSGVLLPYDLRKFYASANGFMFKWTLNFADESDITGKIEINSLNNLARVTPTNDSGAQQTLQVVKDGVCYSPPWGNNYKLFELEDLGHNNSVVVVFSRYKFANNIWLKLDNSKYFYLTSDFTNYFRMSIVHLGIPNWQMLYCVDGPPQWSVNLVSLLVPHLLPGERKDNAAPSKSEQEAINKLDVNIFKGNYEFRTQPVIAKKKSVCKEKICAKPKTRRRAR